MFSGLLVIFKLGKSLVYITINLIFIYRYPHVPYLPTYKMIPTLQLSIFGKVPIQNVPAFVCVY